VIYSLIKQIYLSESTKKTKFLILRFSSIGDIVLTSPVVRCIKLQYPGAEVHFCTKKLFESLVVHNPYIDKVWLLDEDINGLVGKLKTESFDYIIDLHHNLRTLWIKLNLWRVPAFSFDKLNIKKWLYVRFKWNAMPSIHIVDRYMDTLAALHVVNDHQGLEFFYEPTQKVNIADAFNFAGKAYYVFVIGAKFKTKQLPMNHVAAWIKRLTLPVILVGGKEDVNDADLLCKMLPNVPLANAVGKYNLAQSASIIEQSAGVFTNDTGMMHIAAAFRKKIVSFWGNTTPALGMYPYQAATSIIIENKALNCRPCSKIGFKSCPKGHFNCMQSLTPEQFMPEGF
jgi:ADP-heptose:LPS heptosyltransferase